MKFKFNGEEFDIRFRYERCCYSHYKWKKLFDTICTISRIVQTIPRGRDRYVRYAEATASLDSRDVFVKDTGRKIALTRALRFQDRDFRTAAWNAYLNRK